MKKDFTAFLYVAVIGFIFGSNSVANRFSLGQFDPNVFNSLRLIIATVVYTGFFLIIRKGRFPRGKKLWLRAGLYGAVGLTLPMTLLLNALQYLSSGVVSLLITINPILTGALAHVLLDDEPFTGKKIIGMLFGFCGAGLIIITGENGLGQPSVDSWIGYVLVGFTLLVVAGSFIFARVYLKDEDPFDTAGIRIFSALLIILPVTLFTQGELDVSRVQISGLLVLLYVSLFGTFLSFLMEFNAIKRFGATFASLSSFLVPISALILGAVFLEEKITWIIIIGMISVLAGLRLMQKS